MELVRGTLGRRVLRWVQSQGKVLCHDTAEQQRLSVLLDELRPIFPEMEQVHGWFVYRQQDQPPNLRGDDAETWRDVTLDGSGVLFAIGISVDGLDTGHDYAVLLILHELCHVLDSGNHDWHYHSALSGLIDRYNEATGRSVRNDFFGLEMRYDSRPVPESWFAPQPAKKAPEGRQFRTEAVDP